MAQLKGGGRKLDRPRAVRRRLDQDSTEAEFDAYFSNPAYYPVGMFDDTVDGNGNPMHNTPLFAANLAAPWGSAGDLQKLDHFSNTVYTVLFDMTDLLTPGGKAFLHKAAGTIGDQLAADYAEVLTATGVPAGPFVKARTQGMPGDGDIRRSDSRLEDGAGSGRSDGLAIDLSAPAVGARAIPREGRWRARGRGIQRP